MRRGVVVAFGVIVALLAVLELAAVPIASRVVGRAVARCVAFDHLEVASVARPVLPRLLIGRPRDVVLAAEGVRAGDLRVDRASLALAEAVLPWARGAPAPVTGTLSVRLLEDDLERGLRSVLPVPAPVELRLRDDVLSVGLEPLSATLDIAIVVAEDGTVELRPSGATGLLDRLGLAPRFPPTEDVQVRSIELDPGELRGIATVRGAPAVGGGGACDRPLAGAGAGP